MNCLMNRLAVSRKRQVPTDIRIKAISVYSDKPFLANGGRLVDALHTFDGLDGTVDLTVLELSD